MTVENKLDEPSKSKKDEVGKLQRDNPASEKISLERNNRSVRQTRFEERQEDASGTSDDSSGESGTEARTNSTAIEVNAMIPREEQIEKFTHRVPLEDQKTPEIALNIKINGKSIKAILDTGFSVTVISPGVYDIMGREFEEEGNIISSIIRKSKLKLFSCERDQAVATSGEYDVKLEHDDFQCITAVIVAKGLAHECLVDMNVLVRWPAMKEAIRVLLQRPPEYERDRNDWSNSPQFARFNNICLPRIMADDELRSKLLAKYILFPTPGIEVLEVSSATSATNLTPEN